MDAAKPKAPSVAELRSWAANPTIGSRIVPLAPSTVRAIADELEALRRCIEQHNARRDAACQSRSPWRNGSLCSTACREQGLRCGDCPRLDRIELPAQGA